MQCMMNCQPQNRKRRNKQFPVWRTDKIPLGTKGRTSILSYREYHASCGAVFSVSRRKLPDRECCVTSFRKRELVGAQPFHLAIARPFCRLHTPLGCALLNIIQQTRSCKFLYYHIFKTCFAFALTNWIIGPEMITVISVHTPNFPPNKTPVTTTKISNAIRTNLICQ